MPPKSARTYIYFSMTDGRLAGRLLPCRLKSWMNCNAGHHRREDEAAGADLRQVDRHRAWDLAPVRAPHSTRAFSGRSPTFLIGSLPAFLYAVKTKRELNLEHSLPGFLRCLPIRFSARCGHG